MCNLISKGYYNYLLKLFTIICTIVDSLSIFYLSLDKKLNYF